MSGITLEQAQAQLDALLAAQVGMTLTVSIGGRSVSYRSMSEMIDAVNYWQRIVLQLSRKASKQSTTSYRLADFRSRQ